MITVRQVSPPAGAEAPRDSDTTASGDTARIAVPLGRSFVLVRAQWSDASGVERHARMELTCQRSASALVAPARTRHRTGDPIGADVDVDALVVTLPGAVEGRLLYAIR